MCVFGAATGSILLLTSIRSSGYISAWGKGRNKFSFIIQLLLMCLIKNLKKKKIIYICHITAILKLKTINIHAYINKSIGDVQPLPWDSKDKAIFAILDDICIANKQNPLSMHVIQHTWRR
jgi:hypothetical protein